MKRMRLNYQIALTYRCNARCQHCCQFLDVLPFTSRDADMRVEDVVESGRVLRESEIEVAGLRLTGGEPLVHENVAELYHAAKEHWRPTGRYGVYSNGIMKWHGMPFRPMTRNLKSKKEVHSPWLLSPADLGVKAREGFGSRPCKLAMRCGRLFDVYGFAPCTMAPAFGRLFGWTVHSEAPTAIGWEEMCRHCVHTVSRLERLAMCEKALSGEIEYPTKTFREALEVRQRDGFKALPKWRDHADKLQHA